MLKVEKIIISVNLRKGFLSVAPIWLSSQIKHAAPEMPAGYDVTPETIRQSGSVCTGSSELE